jgi:hypothetical protein
LAIYLYISIEGEKGQREKKERETKKSHKEGEIEKERGSAIVSKQAIQGILLSLIYFLQFIYDGFLTFLFDLHAAIFVSLVLFNG